MKKHIAIATLLAAGSAFANADVAPGTTVVFDFGRSDMTTEGAINISTTYCNSPYDFQGAKEASGSLGAMAGVYAFLQEGTAGGMGNIPTALPSEEGGWKNPLDTIPSGWGDTFSDALTSQKSSGEDGKDGDTYKLTFTGLAAGYYNLNVLGGFYGKDAIASSISLTLDGANFADTTWTADDLGSSNTASATDVATLSLVMTNGSGDKGYLFDVTNVLVKKGDTLTITISGNTGANAQRTPLNGLKLSFVSAIPEPSTFGLLAGLGALALVGTRRRRK